MDTQPNSVTLVGNEVYRSHEPRTPVEVNWIRANVKNVVRLEKRANEATLLSPAVDLDENITFWQMHVPWLAIPASRLEYLVDLVNGLAKPVLVHCQEGQDRTGLLCASYRVKYQKWPSTDAMSEAVSLGYRIHINWGLNKTWKDWLDLQQKQTDSL